MKPCGGEGWRVWLLRPARVRTGYSLRTVLMTRECLGWFLAPTVVASHGRLGGARPTRGPTCGPACGPARGSTCKPIRGPTRGSNPEKLPLRKAHELRLANFSLYSADAVPSANMDATEKTPFVGAERPLAGDAPRARGSWICQLARPRQRCSRQREFSVAFGEKARDRWAARRVRPAQGVRAPSIRKAGGRSWQLRLPNTSETSSL